MKMLRGCMHRWFRVLQLLRFLVIVNSVWYQLNFNGLGLLFKITFWYWNVLLSLVATDGRDGHIYLLSQLFFLICLQKKTKQTKNEAFSMYIEKFTRVSTFQCAALNIIFYTLGQKNGQMNSWAKLTFIFWLNTKILESARTKMCCLIG